MGQADLVTNACEADSPAKTELAAGNSNPRGVVALAIMLAIAAFILRYSLSHAPYGPHIDEPIVANLTHRAISDGKLSANWDHFSGVWWTKPTYQFSPYSLVMEVTAVVTYELSGWPETIQDHIRLARTMSCVFGALAVFLTFFAAGALFGQPWTALLCELILAVAFLHVRDSTYARVEAFLALTIMACFYLAAKSLQPGAAKWWSYATAVVGGIVVAAKYNAAPIVIPVAFAALATTKPTQRDLGTLVVQCIKYGLFMLVGFLIATPDVLFSPRPLFQGITWEMSHYSRGEIPYRAYDFWDNNLFYYSSYLYELGFGYLAYLLAVGFLYLAWRKNSPPYTLLMVYLYVAFVLAILPTARFERNLEILLGPMAIAAGATGGALIQSLRTRFSLPVAQMTATAFVVAIVVQPVMAFQRFSVATRKESSPMTAFKREMPPRDDSTVTYQMFNDPPEHLPDAERIVIVDYRDKFGAAQCDNWDRRLAEYTRYEFRSSWSEHDYPFSMIDAVHGPARLVVYEHPDSSETD